MATLPRLMELAQLPGLGVGIVQQGTLVWSHYAGVANASSKDPVIPASLFPAASLGKPIFAYAVLQMVEEGKLVLDRPLQEYLNDDTLRGALAKKITARHVLSHSTGLVNWRSRPGELLTPRFEPGTRFQYSGEGFYLLQRSVEKITGVGFEQFLQDRIFKPMGMTSSTYLWRADAGKRLVAGHRGTEPFYNRDFAAELWQMIQTSNKPLQAWNSELIVQEMSKNNSSGQKPEPNETVPNVAFSLLTTVSDYCAFLGRLLSPRGEAPNPDFSQGHP
jgi:CubicO group peptidase (beta-lactamase class C family)